MSEEPSPVVIHASHRYLANSTVEEVEVSTHRIHFGGKDDDGYCYVHQSFECVVGLTEAERAAVRAL